MYSFIVKNFISFSSVTDHSVTVNFFILHPKSVKIFAVAKFIHSPKMCVDVDVFVCVCVCVTSHKFTFLLASFFIFTFYFLRFFFSQDSLELTRASEVNCYNFHLVLCDVEDESE